MYLIVIIPLCYRAVETQVTVFTEKPQLKKSVLKIKNFDKMFILLLREDEKEE